jgi:hypothetical protein
MTVAGTATKIATETPTKPSRSHTTAPTTQPPTKPSRSRPLRASLRSSLRSLRSLRSGAYVGREGSRALALRVRQDVDCVTERRPCPSPGRAGSRVHAHHALPARGLLEVAPLSVDRARAGGCAEGQPPLRVRGLRSAGSEVTEHRKRLGRREVHRYRLTNLQSWRTRSARGLRRCLCQQTFSSYQSNNEVVWNLNHRTE